MINRLTRNRIKRFRKKYFCEIWGEYIAKKKLNRNVTRYLQAFDYKYRLYCNAKLELFLKQFYKKGSRIRKRFRFEHNKLLSKSKSPLNRLIFSSRRVLFWENFYSFYRNVTGTDSYHMDYVQDFLQNLLLRRWIFYRKRRYHFIKLKRWKKYYPRVFFPKFSYICRDTILITQLRYFYLCFNKDHFRRQYKLGRELIDLEYTLAVFLFRLNLVYNMFQARRFIRLGYVTVNDKVVDDYNYKLVAGDVVSFDKNCLKKVFFFLKKRESVLLNIPNYMLADYKTLSFLIWRPIETQDIVSPIQVDPQSNFPLKFR